MSVRCMDGSTAKLSGNDMHNSKITKNTCMVLSRVVLPGAVIGRPRVVTIRAYDSGSDLLVETVGANALGLVLEYGRVPRNHLLLVEPELVPEEDEAHRHQCRTGTPRPEIVLGVWQVGREKCTGEKGAECNRDQRLVEPHDRRDGDDRSDRAADHPADGRVEVAVELDFHRTVGPEIDRFVLEKAVVATGNDRQLQQSRHTQDAPDEPSDAHLASFDVGLGLTPLPPEAVLQMNYSIILLMLS